VTPGAIPSPEPFRFRDCSLTIVSLGRVARNLRELRAELAAVPVGSLQHHFYDAFLRPSFDDREYRNDFAAWSRRMLRDAPLAERLSVVDPLDCDDFEDVRDRLIEVVEERLAEDPRHADVPEGMEFRFLRSQLVYFDTGVRATTIRELFEMLPKTTTGSVFYHFVEARFRSPHKRDDYSAWLLGFGDEGRALADRLARVDFQLWSLPETRARIAGCLDGTSEGPA
jgi:hypothetical protein